MKLINIKNTIVSVIFLISVGTASIPLAADMSVEAQENLNTLIKTNQCIGCDLKNGDFNRLVLSGADLSGADLSGATFYLSDLSGANLSNTNLRNTHFGGADLAGADLRGADLRGANLSGAYTGGSKMDGSFVEVSVSDDEELSDITEKVYIQDDSVPKDVPEKKAVTIGERKDFGSVPPQIVVPPVATQPVHHKADNKSVSLADKEAPVVKKVSPVKEITILDEPAEETIEINNAIEQGSKSAVNADTTSLETSTLEQTTLPPEEEVENESEAPAKINNSEAVLDNKESKNEKESPEKTSSSVSQVTVEQENIDANKTPEPMVSKAAEEQSKIDTFSETSVASEPSEKMIDSASDSEELIGEQISDPVESLSDQKELLLRKAVKTKKCYNCDLSGSDLAGKNFDGADLEKSNFNDSNLTATDFEDANLKGASFRNAMLENAVFKGADLYKADFTGADLTGANFSKALLDDVNFNGAKGYSALTPELK